MHLNATAKNIFWFLINDERSTLSKLKRCICFVATYLALFFLIFCVGYQSFWQNERSFVWSDGYTQHVPALVYLGQYYREFLSNLFSGSGIAMVDFRIGLGDDIIRAFTHNAQADIFTLCAAFIQPENIEVYYNIVVVLRMILAGLSFAAFCVYMKQKNWASILGALIYTYSGYSIFAAVRHPTFIIAMVYTPVLLIGVDKILNKKSPIIFIIAVFLSALTGFYFIYMETIFLFIYILIRIHSLGKGHYFKRVFFNGLRVVGSYLVGMMMACIILIPMIIGFFGSSRSSHINTSHLLFYAADQNFTLFTSSISVRAGWDWIGMAAIILVAATVLLVKKVPYKKYLLITFLTLLAFRCIPLGGLIFNGFGYVSGRWMFLLAFVLSFMVVYMLPYLKDLSNKEMVACSMVVAVYGFIVMYRDKSRSVYTMVGLVFLILTFFVIAFREATVPKELIPVNKRGKTQAQTISALPSKIAGIMAVSFVIVLNLIANTYYTYYDELGGYSKEFRTSNTVYSSYLELPTAPDSIKSLDDSFYRTENPQAARVANNPIILDYYGITEFWSTINGSVVDAMFELENLQTHTAFYIKGFDNRAILNTLSSVKYVTIEADQRGYLPYGYELFPVSNTKENTDVYINKFFLPIGYTYSQSISVGQYNALNALDKQEAMLQAIVLPDEYANLDVDKLTFSAEKVAYEIELSNVTWESGVLNVKKANAKLTLTFNGLPNSETYVRLVDFDNNELSAVDINFNGQYVNKSQAARFVRNSFYYGKHDYLANLGYSEMPQSSVEIVFPTAGAYTLRGIEIFCYPFDNYEQQVQDLNNDVLENVAVNTNKIEGTISLEADKILCLSIPYSDGWTAIVDGEERELLQANTMFMALPLEAGYHEVQLQYVTPGLTAGIALSLGGILTFIAICIRVCKKRSVE